MCEHPRLVPRASSTKGNRQSVVILPWPPASERLASTLGGRAGGGSMSVLGCRPVRLGDRNGEGFRMPAVTGAAKGKGRRTETAQARTRGAPVRRYGDLRFLLRSNEWRGDCRMRFTRGSWW